MSTAILLSESNQGVLRLTLNRPERRNALSEELLAELDTVLERTASDRTIRAVVLGSAGTIFSSGHDLGEMAGRSEDEYRALFARCSRVMQRLRQLPQPVIARVQGLATAAGCQLVAACDLAVASTEARFATPGVKIGLFCTTPMVEVTRTIGRKRALEMLLTGTPIDAETAAAWGLVNRVVAPDELEAATDELAQRIASASSLTVGIGKRAFYRQIDLGIDAAYELCQDVMSENAAADDAQEGMSAFLEKRAPTWRGR